MPIEIASIVSKMIQSVSELIHDKEKQKRLFLLECRHNLGILGMTEWDKINREFKLHLLTHLKTEICETILIHFENDLLNHSLKNIKSIFKSDSDEPRSSDLFVQIITKINMLKIITTIPKEHSKYEHAHLEIRISHLRQCLLEIINELDK